MSVFHDAIWLPEAPQLCALTETLYELRTSPNGFS